MRYIPYYIYIALSLGQNFLLVLLYLGDVLLGYRHIVLEVEVVEYGTEWEGLHLLEEGETLEALAFVLVLAQCGKRLKECLEQRLLGCTYADDVGTDAIDGCVEIVEADVGTVEGVGTHKLGEEVAGVVVEECHVVGIPVHGAAHVEHQLGHEEEEAGYHIAHILGWLVVAGVEGVDGVVLGAIACEEVV